MKVSLLYVAIGVGLVIAASAGIYLAQSQNSSEDSEMQRINSFEECVNAGNKVTGSHLRQCNTQHGQKFIEPSYNEEKCRASGGLWGAWYNNPDASSSCNNITSDKGDYCTDSSQCQSFCQATPGSKPDSAGSGTCYGYELAICMQEVQNGTIQSEWCQ